MTKVEINKQTIIELWNSQCSSTSDSSLLERKGTTDGEMLSLFINNEVSMMLFKKSLKIVFGGQIEYASEEVSDEEVASLEQKFLEAEERTETLNREEVIRKGINSLNGLLTK